MQTNGVRPVGDREIASSPLSEGNKVNKISITWCLLSLSFSHPITTSRTYHLTWERLRDISRHIQ